MAFPAAEGLLLPCISGTGVGACYADSGTRQSLHLKASGGLPTLRVPPVLDGGH